MSERLHLTRLQNALHALCCALALPALCLRPGAAQPALAALCLARGALRRPAGYTPLLQRPTGKGVDDRWRALPPQERADILQRHPTNAARLNKQLGLDDGRAATATAAGVAVTAVAAAAGATMSAATDATGNATR